MRTDVPGLETGVARAAPIGDRDFALPGGRERGELRILRRRDGRVAGVAEHVDVKAIGVARGRDPREHRVEIADHAIRQFIADAKKDRDRSGDRLVAPDLSGRRIDGGKRIAREAHDDEADDCVPESDHSPGQRHGEEQKEEKIENAETAGGERRDRHPKERGHRENDQRAIDRAALEYR